MIFVRTIQIVLQGVVVFMISTTLFDVVHYLLHTWQRSRFSVLQKFARWHNYHHAFLDSEMIVHREVGRENLYYHLIPEYLTSLGGALVLVFVFDWRAVVGAMVARSIVFAHSVYE
ncbi:MAG TPA: hypothetical protein VHV77_16235, partial [Pirellulales bacterium]|nr:hypothetical protein [Pirellulales bacterium]